LDRWKGIKDVGNGPFGLKEGNRGGKNGATPPKTLIKGLVANRSREDKIEDTERHHVRAEGFFFSGTKTGRVAIRSEVEYRVSAAITLYAEWGKGGGGFRPR